VKAERERSSNLRESGRRVVAMVVTLCCHLGLLMLMLRPGLYVKETVPVLESRPATLQLRFFRRPQKAHLPVALPAPRLIAPAQHIHAMPPSRPTKSLLAQPVAPVVATLSETSLAGTQPTTNQYVDNDASPGDGGFRERLLNAQRSHGVQAVPGSDTHFVPGIRLTDPHNQGVGAVMRKAQRLFGVTNQHCIDVDVWRHLTPQELNARHISSRDVDKIDQKYDCNKPSGLSI